MEPNSANTINPELEIMPEDEGRGRRALVIDNWDSFTANVCGLIHKVTEVEPYLVPNTISPNALHHLIQEHQPDFIVLSPGPGSPLNPDDFGVNQYVLEQVPLPVLGICLGMQGIAAYHGATIERVLNPRHGFPRPVYHNRRHPLFRDIPSPFTAVCYNSLCARGSSTRFEAVAWTEDGVVMAIDAIGAGKMPQIGIQFHPESYLTDCGDLLIRNFLSHFVHNSSGPWLRLRKNPLIRLDDGTQRMSLAYRKLASISSFSDVVLTLRERLVSSSSPNSECLWLDSADSGNFSYFAVSSHHRVKFDLEKRHVIDSLCHDRMLAPTESFFDYLKLRISSFVLTKEARELTSELPFDFIGGYMGYLSYEMKSECGVVFPNSNNCCSNYYAAAFAFIDRFIAFDHRDDTAYIVALYDAVAQVLTLPLRQLKCCFKD